jgi:hypothetical protein
LRILYPDDAAGKGLGLRALSGRAQVIQKKGLLSRREAVHRPGKL